MQKLLLLHGAIGSQQQFDELRNHLQNDFEIHTLNFSGHGGNPLPDEPFSIGVFASDVLNYLEKNDIELMDIFGYSMGGYVALYLAKYFPFRVGKIFTLATKFNWNEESASKESKMLDANVILEKLPAFANELAQRHQPADWKIVLGKTAAMMLGMGSKIVLSDSDLQCIDHTILLSVGDKDKMVTEDETYHAHQNLKNSTLFVFNDTQHPIERVDAKVLAKKIKAFLVK
ncbi:MAG: alpha/beta fold hydrolase [Bacteroidia bacterium]